MSQQSLSTNTTGSLQDRKILIVDDVADNRLLVTYYLNKLGLKLYQAGNGVEALDMISKQDFDLILLDIQMPLMDGHQVMEKLKSTGYQVPVIAITAHAMKEEKDRCLAAGFSGYITKPIERAKLIQQVQEKIEAYQKSSQH